MVVSGFVEQLPLIFQLRTMGLINNKRKELHLFASAYVPAIFVLTKVCMLNNQNNPKLTGTCPQFAISILLSITAHICLEVKAYHGKSCEVVLREEIQEKLVRWKSDFSEVFPGSDNALAAVTKEVSAVSPETQTVAQVKRKKFDVKVAVKKKKKSPEEKEGNRWRMRSA